METIKELNIKELEQVAGGITWCFGVGISDTPEVAACAQVGSSTCDDYKGIGANACAYIGIGFGTTTDHG